MFRQFLENQAGSSIYVIISLMIFLIFFLLVGIVLWKMNKTHIQYMSDLPLTDDKKESI